MSIRTLLFGMALTITSLCVVACGKPAEAPAEAVVEATAEEAAADPADKA